MVILLILCDMQIAGLQQQLDSLEFVSHKYSFLLSMDNATSLQKYDSQLSCLSWTKSILWMVYMLNQVCFGLWYLYSNGILVLKQDIPQWFSQFMVMFLYNYHLWVNLYCDFLLKLILCNHDPHYYHHYCLVYAAPLCQIWDCFSGS